MPVTKRNNSWQASVVHEGKRLRYSFRTEQEARLWEKEAELAAVKGLAPSVPAKSADGVAGKTVADLLVLTHQSKWASLKTDVMFDTGRRAANELGPDLEVREVTYERVVAWVASLRDAGLSQSTINKRLAALSAMLGVAMDLKWIKERPKLPFGKERKHERRYLLREEEEAILANLEGTREWTLVVLAVETGLRLSELLGLRWRDIGKDRVTVVESKNGLSRTVPLTKRARAVVADLPRDAPGPFAGMNRFEASRRFRAAAVAAAITDKSVVFHSLRHTCASRLVMSGVDIRRVQVWMGHRTIQSTLVYAHLSTSSLQDSVAQYDRFTETEYLVRDGRDTCGRIGVTDGTSAG